MEGVSNAGEFFVIVKSEVKSKPRTVPEFTLTDHAGKKHKVFWESHNGIVYIRACDVWRAITNNSGTFTITYLKLPKYEPLSELRFPDSPATRAVYALTIEQALRVCANLSAVGAPAPFEKWLRDQLAPAAGVPVKRAEAAMLTAPFLPGVPISPVNFQAPPPPPQPPVAPPPPKPKAPAPALHAELDPVTLDYVLFFIDGDTPEFRGVGYCLPAISPVPGQVLWPERLGVAVDDVDRLFALSTEEAIKLEPCLWLYKGPDGAQRRVIDQTGWGKLSKFASVKALPDQGRALTALFEHAARLFKTRAPEAEPGCITVISEPPAPQPPYPANAPQPEAPPPAPQAQNTIMPARKMAYWSASSRSIGVRVGQDGQGGLWLAKVDLEQVLGDEMSWPYDARDASSGKIMHDSKVFAAISETAIPLIVASLVNGTQSEGLKFAKWWADTVQPAFGQAHQPVNRVWPIPGGRAAIPTLQARDFSYCYNGKRISGIWTAQDDAGDLWVMRRDLENIFGPLTSWPREAKSAKRVIVENRDGKYPAVSEDIIGVLARNEKSPSAKVMVLDFELWFAQEVAPAFDAPASAAKAPVAPAKAPAEGPRRAALEGDLMTFFFKGDEFDILVAPDKADTIWAAERDLETVFGMGRSSWPQAVTSAPARLISYKGATHLAISEKWLEGVAAAAPLKNRAQAFTTWWVNKVMPYFDTASTSQPAPRPFTKVEEVEEVVNAKSVELFSPTKTQEGNSAMSYQAREIAKLLMNMADTLDAKEKENALLRAQLSEREVDRKKLEAIQAALGLK